ncbi:MAG: TAT-variant-translocated molybdopterin oxidoreductase [Bacteroidetes bacterium]|nr:TAT-variant-translocated molybdopterin oxidoreductase [Bacteroidota bacterium]
MDKKQHWQTLEELNPTPEYKAKASREFEEELPVIDYMEDVAKVESTGRRDFLKMLGFSVSAAAVAASCKIPVRKAIPYVFDGTGPYENLVPGIAEYFASSFIDGSGVTNVLVKTREGRPIKIEGNKDGNITKGGASARAQASVLDLYDHTRLAAPVKGADAGTELTWQEVDGDITRKLRDIASAGGRIVVLSNTLASPVYEAAIEEFKAKFPTVEHVVYDAVSLSAMREANATTLGEAIIPSYRFDKADVIVGVNCDFLGTWLSPVEFTGQYAQNKIPSPANGKKMLRHYQFQSNVTITGSSADYKIPVKPSQEKATLISLYNAVTSKTGGSRLSGGSNVAGEMVAKAASDLVAARGKALVVCGTNDVDCQLITNAINAALGSYGSTIDTVSDFKLKAGDDKAMASLVSDIKSGGVKALITLDANPVYNTAGGADLATAMSKLDLFVALSNRVDETSGNATYVCAGRHYLESWNLLEPKSGEFCFVQPTINPLFTNTRSYLESLLTWAGNTSSEYDYIKAFTGNGLTAGEQEWIKALKAGSVSMIGGTARAADAASTLAAVSTSSASASGVEVVLYESVAVGDGTMGNNPYLQEMADPLGRATWDNFLAISYDIAEANGIKDWYNNKVVPTGTVTKGDSTVTLPVVVQFGMAPGTVAIALGYGRTKAGRAGDGVGVDLYPWLSQSAERVKYSLDGANVSFNKKAKYRLALVQVYGTLMEEYALPGKTEDWRNVGKYRGGIVKETNLANYKKDDLAGNEDRAKILHHLKTMYPAQEFQGHHWGLTVDMNACNGCGACIVACNIENNVPVVGHTEVFRGHDMHWMRIDRYYSGDKNNPDVAFQPLMCQHCDHAPCENVCPVNATNHSSEGLNQMAYNRCIGTRYCANNCPYKVRRFNWLDYQAADYFGKFNDNRKGWGDEGQTDYMFEDLTRMVLNPDVTVRCRGVIEKCSFCVQRIQEGKLQAKKEARPLRDGDIKTACQTTCPSNAIAFGDLNDKDSEVHKLVYKNSRNYHLLEEQHFLPSIGYSVKVRNTDEEPIKNFS